MGYAEDTRTPVMRCVTDLQERDTILIPVMTTGNVVAMTEFHIGLIEVRSGAWILSNRYPQVQSNLLMCSYVIPLELRFHEGTWVQRLEFPATEEE